jgi:tetratricopeptide (TPR) repeat protein
LELGEQSGRFSLSLLGPFRFIGPGGMEFALSSKKGIALIAMLATSANGERTRGWLQEKLWGSREEPQARASLRRELSNLRKIVKAQGGSLLSSDGGRVRLRLDVIDVDVVRLPGGGWSRRPDASIDAEFLEGIDIRGEESFEEWLGAIRSALAGSTGASGRADTAAKAGDALGAKLPRTPEARADVAVHRIANRTNDGDAGSSADELTDELIGLLARFHWLSVGLKADAETEAEVALSSAPAAHAYAVETALAGVAGARRLDVKLWEARERRLVWTGRFEQSGEPLRLAVSQICARIEREEQARANKGPEEPGDFAHLIWRGRWRLNRLTREDSAVARRLFDQAIALVPDSPEALIQKTTALCWEKWALRAPRNEFTEIRDLARRAILIDPDDCRGYWLAGVAETWLRNPTAAIGVLTRAIELNPCFEPAHAQLGGTLNLSDRPEEALKALEHALTLSPYDTHVFFRYAEIGMSWCMLGKFKTAIEWVDRALLQRPAYWYAHIIKIHALVEEGDDAAAGTAGRELREIQPNFDSSMIEWLPFLDRNWVERLCRSLSRAGAIPASDSG